MRRWATSSFRSMSLIEAQFAFAIASSPARPRTVSNAGHSNTALSVNRRPYAAGSRSRYAFERRALSESTLALTSLADGVARGPDVQASVAHSATRANARGRFVGDVRCLISGRERR